LAAWPFYFAPFSLPHPVARPSWFDERGLSITWLFAGIFVLICVLLWGACRFPPPWSAEETEACYIVRDANGQAP
jgi:hypothetical protein